MGRFDRLTPEQRHRRRILIATTWGAGTATAAPAAYTGPRDVIGSAATAWYGLRAYSSSGIGGDVVRLRRDSDNAEQTFVSISGGGLDTAAITAFKGAANLFVATLFDQSAGGFHLTQAVAANQIPFILSGVGSLPVLRFNADSLIAAVATGPTLAEPHTDSWVAKRTGNFTTTAAVGGELDGTPRSGFLNATNTIFLFAGSVLSAAAADNSFHAVQAVYNGASSDLNINGSANAGTSGGTSYAAAVFQLNVDSVMRTDVTEFGVWPIAFTGTQSTNMSANQHAYWGF